MLRAFVVVAGLLLSGCRVFFPAPSPMRSVFDPLPGPTQGKCLVVLLPGVGDTAGTFRTEGFVEAIHRSGASADVIAANATLGYYLRGIAPHQIEEDVVAPLRARKYAQVWLIGISMGGFGSIHYSQAFPEQIDGFLALAPYLGEASLGDENPKRRRPRELDADDAAPLDEDNYQRQMWSWLHNVTTGKHKGPEIYLGYGDQDGHGPEDAVLAAALPKDHVFHVPGGHTWAPWRALLQQFLKSSEFQRRCAP